MKKMAKSREKSLITNAYNNNSTKDGNYLGKSRKASVLLNYMNINPNSKIGTGTGTGMGGSNSPKKGIDKKNKVKGAGDGRANERFKAATTDASYKKKQDYTKNTYNMSSQKKDRPTSASTSSGSGPKFSKNMNRPKSAGFEASARPIFLNDMTSKNLM